MTLTDEVLRVGSKVWIVHVNGERKLVDIVVIMGDSIWIYWGPMTPHYKIQLRCGKLVSPATRARLGKMITSNRAPVWSLLNLEEVRRGVFGVLKESI